MIQCIIESFLIFLVVEKILSGFYDIHRAYFSILVASLILFLIIFLIDFTSLMMGGSRIVDRESEFEIKETFRNVTYRKGHT